MRSRSVVGLSWLLVVGCGQDLEPEFEFALQGISEPFAQAGGAEVVLEAENFHRQVNSGDSGWQVVEQSGASSTYAVQAASRSNVRFSSNFAESSPRLDFDVHFAVAGNYYLWARMRDPGRSSDTCHVGVDGAASTTSANVDIDVRRQWIWTNQNTSDERVLVHIDSPGLHTVNLWMRERNVLVDKLVLTTDERFDPASQGDGLGPDESPRLPSAPTDAGAADSGTPADAGSPNADAGSDPSDAGGQGDDSAEPHEGYLQSGGLVAFEAELHDGLIAVDGHSWIPTDDPGAVGQAMQAAPDVGRRITSDFIGRSPRLDYNVTFTETGPHYLWIRMRDPGDSADTCHAGFNGAASSVTSNVDIDRASDHTWTNHNTSEARLVIDVPSVGLHQVNLWMREDGSLIDRILLTTDPNYDPSSIANGEGPPASLRGGMGNPAGCGDGMCEGGEDCRSCASDCGMCAPSCGDGTCNENEDCAACSSDCGMCAPSCGDGTCDAGEDCNNCASDCGTCIPSCGDGTCEGSEDCGSCAEDCGMCPPPPTGSLRAFPGAEGFGAQTPGGRGGAVLFVTNTNDSGPGSLREALSASGPRIVVFRTGGTIVLQSGLSIRDPYVTVAGQTAPGGGIAIRNGSSTSTSLRIATHDVVVRGLRIRPGPGGEPDGIYLNGSAYDTVIDHCSVSWAVDENITAAAGAHDITVQWSIVSQGLLEATHGKGKHSMGLMLGSGGDSDTTHNITVHHTLLAHNFRRNPLSQANGVVDFVNNTIYNWGDNSWSGYAGGFSHRSQVNYVGNYIQHGPSSNDEYPVDVYSSAPDVRVFVQGNYSSLYRMSMSDPESNVLEPGDEGALVSSPFGAPAISTQEASVAHEALLQNAGARLPRRDAVDAAVVQSMVDGTALIIDDPSEMGGWPTLASGTAPSDTDNDGMPDAFEQANGLNPNSASDANQTSLSRTFTGVDGYTNIEVYINSLWN